MAEAPLLTATPSANAENPFFLIGAERSGTSLLRLMLDHHPQVLCLRESTFVVDYLTSTGEEPSPKALAAELSIDRTALLAGFEVDQGASYIEASRDFLRQAGLSAGKPIWGATIHRHFTEILHIWPQARFLNIVRDPRDVAPSVVAMGWSGNTFLGSKPWVAAQKNAMELRDSLPPDRWMNLRFEDLVSEPEVTLERACRFLGCEYHSAMLNYPKGSSYPAPDASAAARWKTKLSHKEIQLVESKVGGLLVDAGYKPSGHPLLQIGPFQEYCLKLQSRLFRIRFRIRRYGFLPIFSFFLFRKIGMKRASNKMLMRMHSRTNNLLR